MNSILTVLVLASLIFPVSSISDYWTDDTIAYMFGMGMMRQEVLYMPNVLKAMHQAGEITDTEYKTKMSSYNENAKFVNRFLKGNFNNTIYLKWKLPILPVSSP